MGPRVPDVVGGCFFPTYGPHCEHSMVEQAPEYLWYRIINGIVCITVFLLALWRNYTLDVEQTPMLQRLVLRGLAFATFCTATRIYDPVGITSVSSWVFSRVVSDATTATLFGILIVMAAFHIAIARMSLSKSVFTPAFRRLVACVLGAMAAFIMATSVWKVPRGIPPFLPSVRRSHRFPPLARTPATRASGRSCSSSA